MITKSRCEVISLGKPLFINVRRSTILREYNTSGEISNNIESNIIIGDYNGESYNITNII